MYMMPYVIALTAAFCLIDKAWRRTAAIILLSSVLGIFVASVIETNVLTENVYFIAGLWDAITAYLVLKFGKSGKYAQAALLAVSVLTNAFLLLEFKMVPSLFHNWYDEIIFGLNIIQTTLFAGGIHGAFCRLDNFRDVADRMVANEPADHGSHRHRGGCASETVLEDGQ